MKLLIIGHTVEDHFKNKIKPGGLYYSVWALNMLKSYKDKIYPCTSVVKKEIKKFFPLYQKSEKSFLNYVNKIPKIHLQIFDDREREEVYENINKPLRIPFNSLRQFDGILINMITGFDVTLSQLKKIRKNFEGTIYLDVHTLSRGLDKKMKRNFRIIKNFKEWAKNVDIVQANENELRTLSRKKGEHDIAKEVLKQGVKWLIVTKSERGVRLFSLSKFSSKLKDKELISYFISASKTRQENKIGCGDVFGAAFFYFYIKGKEFFETLNIANKAAGEFVSTNVHGSSFKKNVLSGSN